MRREILVSVIALFSLDAAQAQDADASHLSLAAGYKAAFTCSAHFNAGRTVEQIAGDELHRIYPNYREAMAALPDAVIDEDAKRVSVSYAEDFPPRIAQWRPYLGCAQLPSGASEDMADDLATVAFADIFGKAPRLHRVLPRDVEGGSVLADVVASAFDRATYGEGTETSAALVVKDGVIIAEQYRDGFGRNVPQRTWSVAKSIAATIIGAAVEDGLISVDEPAALKAWSSPGDPRGKIRIVDLMHMSSGLDATPAGNRTDDVYHGGGRVIDHAITRRLIAEPGTRWYYANNDTMAMMRALRERMEDDHAFLVFPFKETLYPIGMLNTFLETDWNGDFVLSSQVWTTARDLARLGLLYLNDGVWEGERILPKGWAKFVAAPAPDQPRDRREGENRAGYGAQFWLFGERHGLPEGTYAAMGNRGQFLVIIPARNVLVVRRGFDDGGGFDIVRFSADVLAALED
jgi:CubicO group peptidase (beta-lactamase class C family)